MSEKENNHCGIGKKVVLIRKGVEINCKKKEVDEELVLATKTLMDKVVSGEVTHFVLVTFGVDENDLVVSHSQWFGDNDYPEFTYVELENIKDDYRDFFIRPYQED